MASPLRARTWVPVTLFVATAIGPRSAHADVGASKSPAPSAAPAGATGDAAAPSSSASADDAKAKELFDEAVALATEGNYEAACGKLEQSLKLHAGLGTAFHLAGCWQRIGRTASSYGMFEVVARKAHELGQTEHEQTARSKMEALLPKLSRLRIEVDSRGPRTEVLRDDQIVPESDWRKPVPVDRGTHEIRVTAEGKAPWSTRVDIDTPGTTVAVIVPSLTAAVPEAAPPPAPPLQKKAAPPPPAEKTSSGSGQRVAAFIVGGVGVAALAGGIVAGVQYRNDNDAAKSICPTGAGCSPEDIAAYNDAVSDAKKERTWAFVGIGAGSAALVAATLLYVSAPSAPEQRDQHARAARLRVSPLVDGRGAYGAVLHGSF